MQTKENNLLSLGAACRELGLKPQNKDWRSIRKILIRDYGANHIEGAGWKIPYSQVKKFLADNFSN